jgi:hypothetical protein
MWLKHAKCAIELNEPVLAEDYALRVVDKIPHQLDAIAILARMVLAPIPWILPSTLDSAIAILARMVPVLIRTNSCSRGCFWMIIMFHLSCGVLWEFWGCWG